jgi:hypothetical protein
MGDQIRHAVFPHFGFARLTAAPVKPGGRDRTQPYRINPALPYRQSMHNAAAIAISECCTHITDAARIRTGRER